MLKVAVLGGGGHSRGNHLPALRRYYDTHPGQIELTAFCDLDPQTAGRLAQEFGFAHHYTDLATLLAGERVDAFIAITPVSVTAHVAEIILRAGIPLLMEKPPGATPAEVNRICQVVDELGGRVMVSMNRRFDPAIAAARAWLGERPLHYLRASMLRDRRTEPGFITDTAIHGMDTVRHLGGQVTRHAVRTRRVDGVVWYWIDLRFESGATGVLEIMPTCGCLAESYDLFGAGVRVTTRVAEFDLGTFTTWDGAGDIREHNPTLGMPGYVRNGTYAETEAFLEGVERGRVLFPTPADVRQSVELCHAIADQVRAEHR